MSAADVVVVECQTCTAKALWNAGSNGMTWAVWHSRNTGHPDNYRVKPLDVASIRGRVWFQRRDGMWHWLVSQPGLNVSWGYGRSFVEAHRSCRKSVGLYRRLPLGWSDDSEDDELRKQPAANGANR